MQQQLSKTDRLIINARNLQQANKLEPARAIYTQILKQNPNHVDVLHLMGLLHRQLREYDTAIDYFNRVIALNPNIPQLYHNLGLAYKEQGKFEKAIECYRKAIALRPNYSGAFEKLGNALTALGEYLPAIDHYQRALQLDEKNGDAWLNCGNAFRAVEMTNEAEECYRRALNFVPDSIEALSNLASMLNERKEREAAIKLYKKVLKLAPKYLAAYANLASIYDHACEWHDYEQRENKLYEAMQDSLAAGSSAPTAPLTALSKPWAPEEILALTKNYAKGIAEQAKFIQKKISFSHAKPSIKEKLKIGYISSDLQDHPVAYLTNNLFALHDRAHFEVFVYSLGMPSESVYRKHIAATCDHFLDCCLLDDVAVAKKIYEDQIDILVDLNGYTKGARHKILAVRPAPLQIQYIGYLGTTGADYFDYTIADEIVVPPEVAKIGYSEKIIYLPQYQIFDNQQPIADKVLTRADYGIPEDAFVYCCFNNTYKINPTIYDVWMDILKATPNSILWLFGTSELAERNLRQEAEKRGVSSKRIYFVKYEERTIYLKRYQLADLFLDTPAYNANTTGSDALWAGLPMITTPGTTYAGRGAASSLTALGMPELVLPNLNAYKELAIELCQQPEKLKQVKEKLAKNRLTTALFDTPRFVRNLERGYQKIWEIYANNQPSQDVYIENNP